MKRRVVGFVVLMSVIALSSCAPEQAESGDISAMAESETVSVAVETRTISDVLTLPVVVAAGSVYSVSAPAIGKLESRRAEASTRTPDDGPDVGVRRSPVFTFVPSDGSAPTEIVLAETITSVEPSVPLDVEVGVGTPLLSVTDSALTITAQLTPPQVLRLANRQPLSVRAQLDGSTGPFDCSLNDARPTADAGTYRLTCRVPIETPGVVGSEGLLAIALDERADVPALPIEAIAGARDRGIVYEAATGATRDVTLGITDGAFIEVTSGLSVGDQVLIPSPSLLRNR